MHFRIMTAALLFGLGAIAPRHPYTLARGSAKASVSVTNQNPLDVDVFALVGAGRYRLGTVVTSQTALFDLPSQATVSDQVRLSAAPVGSRETYVSPPVTVGDGMQVNMIVAPRLTQSSVTVGKPATR